LKKYASRDDIVLATKVHFPMHEGPGGSGLSRKAIMEQIDASLARLDTDYVDLYQIHRFDPNTPVEETMEALHDVVKAGKARYIGASSMWAWQFSKMQYTADLHGWTRFVSMQNQYNLMQREEEREMFGLLADQGVEASRTRRLPREDLPGPGVNTASAPRSIPSAAGSTSRATNPSWKRSKRSPKLGASRWRTSHWPGC
jgi:aryl-alcohol dehydrogenase-like predicted oxidoreductase